MNATGKIAKTIMGKYPPWWVMKILLLLSYFECVISGLRILKGGCARV